MVDTLNLGGNIELIGVDWIDSASMIILKKMVGNYVKGFSQKVNVQKLSISMFKSESEIVFNSILVTSEKSHTSKFCDKNLFIGLAESLKNIEKSI